MLLASQVDTDSRVLKEAATLRDAGLDVTIVSRAINDDDAGVTVESGIRFDRRVFTAVLDQPDPGQSLTELLRWNANMSRSRASQYSNWKSAQHRILAEAAEGRMASDDSAQPLAVQVKKTKRRAARTRAPRIATAGTRGLTLMMRAARGTPLEPLATLDRPRALYHRRMEAKWRKRREAILSNTAAGQRRNRLRPTRTLPYLVDAEIAMSGALQRWKPAIIHAHDHYTLPTAIHYKHAMAGTESEQRVRVVYDSHEFVTGLDGHYERERYRSFLKMEREPIAYADATITVTPHIARALDEIYVLQRPTAVVVNAPSIRSDETVSSVRTEVGLAPDVPLGVYTGGVNPNRGLDVLIAALPMVSRLHVAFVVTRIHPNLKAELDEQAAQLGVSDRVHWVDAVRPNEVASFLRDADIGLIVSRNTVGNHQVSWPNKQFEYLHAGIPLVTSNCAALEEFVIEHNTGEVFVSEDSEGLATAIKQVLDNRDSYLEPIPALRERYCWESSGNDLLDVYEAVTGASFPRSSGGLT